MTSENRMQAVLSDTFGFWVKNAKAYLYILNTKAGEVATVAFAAVSPC